MFLSDSCDGIIIFSEGSTKLSKLHIENTQVNEPEIIFIEIEAFISQNRALKQSVFYLWRPI